MILIVPFARTYDRASFDCGVSSLNNWLKFQAGQQERKGNTRTFLAVDSDSNKILGYYASLAGEVAQNSSIASEAPATATYSRPAIRLARLAVALDAQRQGLGGLLLQHFFAGALDVAELIGVEVVIVDAIDEVAGRFYARYGFVMIPDAPLSLMANVKEIRRLVQRL